MALAVEGLLLHRRAGSRLVGPLDLRLGPGARWALVGESGSGKSLVVRALCGALPPGVHQAGGTVRAFGRLLRPDRPGDRGPRLAWMPQEPRQALHPFLTVGEHLALLPWVHRREPSGPALRRLGPLLDRLGLPRNPAFLSRLPHQASGGQRQRVVLAMALSCDPDLLLLDEPTTALDAPARRAFADLVLDLAVDRGLGFLWVTHDLGLAAAVAERVLVLLGGHGLEAGPAVRLLQDPAHPATAALVAAAQGQASPGREPGSSPSGEPDGCPFRLRCPRPQTTCRAWGPWRGDPEDGLRCEAPLALGLRP